MRSMEPLLKVGAWMWWLCPCGRLGTEVPRLSAGCNRGRGPLEACTISKGCGLKSKVQGVWLLNQQQTRWETRQHERCEQENQQQHVQEANKEAGEPTAV